MPYIYYNPNPKGAITIDCVIRAVSKVMNTDWDSAYVAIAAQGFMDKSMPTSDQVWGNYLKRQGFRRVMIPNTCPDCYTVRDFAYDHPRGCYLLKTHEHVVAVCSGNYYDAFDSGSEVPIYYWERSAI